MLAIEARALTKTYRARFGGAGHPALRGVDLAVEVGSAFGLIGPNGAGKTTFVKTLLGIALPTEGTIRLLGRDPRDPRVRARIGYLPERLQLPGALDGLEVLSSVARLKRLRLSEAAKLRALEEVGLAQDARRRVGVYSKGMRQRLGLACCLLGAPDLLLLDEPTDGLDPLARIDVRNRLAREVSRGATLLVNSHLLAEIERGCDRIGILVAGRIVREGALGALRQNTSRWSVRFAPGAAANFAAAGFMPAQDGAFEFEGEPAALNAALDRVRAGGALVTELAHESRNLEQVLADAVEDAA